MELHACLQMLKETDQLNSATIIENGHPRRLGEVLTETGLNQPVFQTNTSVEKRAMLIPANIKNILMLQTYSPLTLTTSNLTVVGKVGGIYKKGADIKLYWSEIAVRSNSLNDFLIREDELHGLYINLLTV